MEPYLPWTPDQLEDIVRDLVYQRIEGFKVDFKAEVHTKTAEQKSELLKDVSAMVNTLDGHYQDFGFLIYGARAGAIEGTLDTTQDGDNLQNTIEQLIREYLSPFFSVYVFPFADAGRPWGVIIIPPSYRRPHLFFKDLQCQDKRKSRFRGEWYVRRGSTTDRAGPEDYAQLLQELISRATEPIQAQLRALQGDYDALAQRVALASLQGHAAGATLPPEQVPIEGAPGGLDLPARLRKHLLGPGDPLRQALLQEAAELHAFLASDELPWNPRPTNAVEAEELIVSVEDRTRSLAEALATIAAHDNNGRFDNTIVQAFKLLAKQPRPTQTFNDPGEQLRQYPLLILLYVAFLVGVPNDRASLLRNVLDVPLRQDRHQAAGHLAEVGFTVAGTLKGLFNMALQQNLCPPVNARIRAFAEQHILPRFPYEDTEEMFFRGEFVLSLAGIEARALAPHWTVPLPGLYLYFRNATDVITAFLEEPPGWFANFYRYPIEEVLKAFDETAMRAVANNCFGEGFTAGAQKAFGPPA